MNQHTILALASAPVKSGVAVIRISGPQAFAALPALGIPALAPRMARLATLTHPATGIAIDSALALAFPGPASFTGEDVLELHCHGSRAVTRALIEALCGLPGFRLAEPGEFSRRAFENGKMDLTQAEGLADLIHAETEAQRAQALRWLQGDAGRIYDQLRDRVIHSLALLEAYIDFPDEEIPESVWAQTCDEVAALQAQLASMLADHHRGERVREGIDIVILGPPNAGKSTLLNAIARREVAIVSDEAGTTRDMLEVHLDLGGYPVTLIDTAGIREAQGEKIGRVEEEGIRRALARAEAAELTLLCFDSASEPTEHKDLWDRADANTLLVLTKCDKGTVKPASINGYSPIPVSAKTGEGMDALLAHLTGQISARYDSVASSLITRTRHRHALEEARGHLARFHRDLPLELNGEALRMSARAIAKITGQITVDDILDRVFSTFCIGK
jgi:tRNA modification GTPase